MMRDLSRQYPHSPGQYEALIVNSGCQRHPNKQNGVRRQKDQNGLQDSPAESLRPLISAQVFGVYGQEILLDSIVIRVVVFWLLLDSSKDFSS